MTTQKNWLRNRLATIYADESTQEIREKLHYYLGQYRQDRPNLDMRDWISGLSIVLKMRLAR